MRILHVTAGIGRSNGVMSVILNYARHMPQDIRFDVMYFVQTQDDQAGEVESLGGRTVKIATPGLHSFRRDDVDAYLSAHRREYAAIHLHLPYLAPAFAPKARRYGIERVIVHCHTSQFSLERSGWRNRLLNIPTKRVADALIACSQDAGAVWFGGRAMRRGQVTVLPNAIETEAFSYHPELREAKRLELGLGSRLVIGHVGTLTTPKNHKFLLSVFAEIYRHRPDAVLLLAGDGVLRPQVEMQIRELGLTDAVRLLGNRQDVPALLQAMDVFLFPSLHEGLGIAAVEAQAAGLPTLISDTIPQVVQMTDTCRRLSLEADPALWARTALELAAGVRKDGRAQVEAAGFDLRGNAGVLAALYKSRLES